MASFSAYNAYVKYIESTCFNQAVLSHRIANLKPRALQLFTNLIQVWSEHKDLPEKKDVSKGGALQVRSGLKKPLKYQNVHASRV